MVFNDVSGGQGILQDAEDKINVPATTLSTTYVKNATRWANIWVGNVITWILESQDEWDYDDSNHTTYPILTADLVALQQPYTLPTDIFKIKKVEITYDGTTWKKMTPLDESEIDFPTDTTTISEKFDVSKPYYDTKYNSLFLFPVPTSAVEEGLKVHISREFDAFTTADTTQEPGFDQMWHYLVSTGIAFEWAKNKGLSQRDMLKQELLEGEQRLRKYYANKQEDRQYSIKTKKVNWK